MSPRSTLDQAQGGLCKKGKHSKEAHEHPVITGQGNGLEHCSHKRVIDDEDLGTSREKHSKDEIHVTPNAHFKDRIVLPAALEGKYKLSQD